ncbi:MAG: GNAT family N-acetyltransferase [Micrococcales bacterium]|nr:GNAT family N-acetyltransferase [Micrococcales bacterium]
MTIPDLVPVSGLDTDPEAVARFDAWAGVLEAAARHDQGEDHDAWSAAELRELEGSASKRRVQVLALDAGEPVGAAGVIASLRDNPEVALLYVSVLPGARRRGTGDALAAWAVDAARGLGRTVLHAETQWGPDSDEDPHEPWMRRHSFAPAQTVLRSDLAVDGTMLPEPAVATGYRLETHVDEMPEADLTDRALLARRMSTDVPLGELELGEEAWDEDRVRGEDERTRAMGRRVVSSFARDLGSGRLVGYTSIQVPGHAPALAFRLNTDEIVLAGPDHPLRAAGDPDTPALYLAVRHGCEARLNRSTYAQLAQIALDAGGGWVVSSQGAEFALVPQ